jgi:hypothetical protein
MVLDPHGNGFANMDLEGRKRETSERLARATRRMDDALRLSESVVQRSLSRPKPPQMNVVRMRPFLPPLIVALLALVAIPLSFIAARMTASTAARASTIRSVDYDKESSLVRVWLDTQVSLDVPQHVHLRYKWTEVEDIVVESYALSSDGKHLDIYIRVPGNHVIIRDRFEFVMRPTGR